MKNKEIAIKIILQMLQDRKYSIIQQTEDKIFYNTNINYTNNKCCLFLNITNKFTRSKLEEYMSVMVNDNLKHIIVIYDTVITPQAKKILQISKQNIIELFKIKDLIYNIINHKLVPKHIKLNVNSTEYKHIFKNYGYKLPKLLESDPISKYYFFKKNDIIEIHRKDGTITYRIVI